jgi:aminomethyltransferase
VNLAAIRYYNFKIGTIADVEDVILSRTGYTGEIGFELYVKNEDAQKLWDSLFSTNTHLKPIGLAARDTLRLEKGFRLYGNDIDESTSPIEAGLGWITKFTKDFINSENLKKEKEEGVSRQLVNLEIVDKGIARKDYVVVDNNGKKIGIVTSGTMLPTLRKAIAIAYVQTEFSKIGTEVFVQVRNKKIKSKVVRIPFVK